MISIRGRGRLRRHHCDPADEDHEPDRCQETRLRHRPPLGIRSVFFVPSWPSRFRAFVFFVVYECLAVYPVRALTR
jgi:hypothetical protein